MTTMERKEEIEVCPICLGGGDDGDDNDHHIDNNTQQNNNALVFGKCGHKFCLPCLKQLFAAPSLSSLNFLQGDSTVTRVPTQEDILDVPTMGRCPICRRTLCLLDLQKQSALRVLPPNDASTEYAVSRETDISRTELAGTVFVKRRRKEGEESIHFNYTGTGGVGFVSFEARDTKWTTDDKSIVTEKKKHFDPSSCYFHKDSRTFHGTLRWDTVTTISPNENSKASIDCGKRLYGSNAWEYILSFSSGLDYVAKGVLIKRRDPCRRYDCKRMECKFPLDGEWAVSGAPKHHNTNRGLETIRIHGNLAFGGNNPSKPLGKVEFDSTSKWPAFTWIDDYGDFGMTQQMESIDPDWRIEDRLEGPAIASLITWLNGPDATEKMTWRRNTVTPAEVPLEVVKLGSIEGVLYNRLGAVVNDLVDKPPYISDKLWGNSFCQVMTVGLASYHFEVDGSAYISYEHERTSVWPNLDNGEPIPPRIAFVNTTFDEPTRTFRGTIDWEGTQGATWTSSRWWRYEMVFARDYSFIIGGNVHVMRRGDDNESIMSKFGEDLLYMNVGFAEQIKDESVAQSNEISTILDEANRLGSIRRQLEGIGAPAIHVSRIQSIFFLAQNTDVQYPATRLYSQQEYGL